MEKKLKLLNMDYADILTIIGPGENYSPERLTAVAIARPTVSDRSILGASLDSYPPTFFS